MADRNDDDGGVGGASLVLGRGGERAQKREGFEVDPREPDAGLLAGRHVAVDQLAVGDDEQDPADLVAVLVDAVAEHLVVEHCLLDRDRQHLLRAEADRVLELLRIVDPGDLEDADADAVVGDPEADALPRQLVLPEERAQLFGEELWLAQLPAYDETVVELLAGDLDELGRAVVDDAGGRKL